MQEDSVSREAQERDTQPKNVEGTTEMKVRLVQIDNEERKLGRRFMKSVKEKLVGEYPEHATASIEKLPYNAARFRKEQTIANLILVRRYEVENNNRETKKMTNRRLFILK